MTVGIESGEMPAIAGARGVLAYLVVAALVLPLMMLLGLLLRLGQGEVVAVSPFYFYQVMTLHGVGMVGIAGFGGAAILWYFARRHLDLSGVVLMTNAGFFLAGVVLIIGAITLGGFAGGWTFLFPLPAQSGGVWSQASAVVFLVGLLLVGLGFLLFYSDIARAVIQEYGGLGRGLGWSQLFGGDTSAMPPPAIVAGTMVLIVNVLGIVAGAAVLLMSLVNIVNPALPIDPLLAKNLIYAFGHIFINASIYMAIIAVYEILPRYTGRPWKSTRPMLAAFAAATVMVVIVYPHHLLMDFAMPTWMLVMGQMISYASGLPVLLVTAYGALVNVHRSGMRWSIVPMFLMLGVFGWSIGVLPAIVDGTIAVNYVMHNTLWVPGHFHLYLLIGLVSMIFGFMYHLAIEGGGLTEGPIDRFCFWLYAAGGIGFAVMFLYSGRLSVPRRWAVHLPEWLVYDQIASVFAALAVVTAVVLMARFLISLPRLHLKA